MMHWFGGGAGPLMLGMGLFWILLIAGIVWLVVELTGSRRGGGPRPYVGPAPWPPAGPTAGPAGESPFDILDRRLASGEIDVAAYREARTALLEGRGGQP